MVMGHMYSIVVVVGELWFIRWGKQSARLTQESSFGKVPNMIRHGMIFTTVFTYTGSKTFGKI